MKYSFAEIFELEELKKLCESFTEINGTATAIVDLEGVVHVATGWQPVCTQFHRQNIETKKRCLESDTILAGQLKQGQRVNIYKCKNGLVDVAVPIIVENQHIGNFFTGQFFTEKPDKEFFSQQARRYGFDEEKYLEAIEKTPIYSDEYIKKTLLFLVQLTEIIGKIGTRNLESLQNVSELKRQNELFSILLQNLTMGVFMVEAPSGKPLLANDAALKILGRGIMPDASKQNLSEVYKAFKEGTLTPYPPDEMPIILGMYGKSAYIDDMVVERPDGSQNIIEVHGTPVKDNHGNIWASLVSFSDITERKLSQQQIIQAKEKAEESEALLTQQYQELQAIEEELRATNEELRATTEALKENYIDLQIAKDKAEESNKLKSAFLQNMSHEVRTPLNAIVGFAELMTTPNLPSHKLARFSNLISESSDRLIAIITDIIEIAQIQSNLVSLKISEFDVVMLLKTMINSFELKAQSKGIELRFKAEIPVDKYVINSDSEKIQRICFHLLDNAIKFTAIGSVEVTCQLENDTINILVADTGIGIPLEMQTPIFEPFRQVELGVVRNFGGNGLGLSIANAYAQKLFGTISLQSEMDKGSIFTVSLPINYAQLKSEEKKLNIKHHSSKTLLIVDDEYSNFEYVFEVLEDQVPSILYAPNGIKAIEMCMTNIDIDFVFMDIKMPLMDGHTAATEIKKVNPDLPIIALTAYALGSEVYNLSTVFDDYITKPIKKDTLLKIAKKYIEQ